MPTIYRLCLVYGVTGACKTLIELQQCRSCSRRFIGPDCRDFGLFNLNNCVLFSHALLNNYTNQYTTSETPFHAWVTSIAAQYEDLGSSLGFVSEEVFRAAWFSFVRLQQLEGDMICPNCGDEPSDTIWDGVTLAFNRSHLLPSLQPPTTILPNAPIREKTQYVPKQQAIPQRPLRQLLRKICKATLPQWVPDQVMVIDGWVDEHGGNIDEAEDDNEAEDEDEQDYDCEEINELKQRRTEEEQLKKLRGEYAQRLKDIAQVHEGLLEVCTGLAGIFWEQYGPDALEKQSSPLPEYRQLFLQVCFP